MATGMKVPAHGACRTGRSSERVCAGPVAGGLGQLVTAASAWPKGWQRAQTGQASAVLALCGAFSLQEHQEVREEGREKSPGGEGTAPEGNEVLPSLLRGHSRPRHPRTCLSSHPISLCCLLPAFSKTWSPMTESTRSGPRAARPPRTVSRPLPGRALRRPSSGGRTHHPRPLDVRRARAPVVARLGRLAFLLTPFPRVPRLPSSCQAVLSVAVPSLEGGPSQVPSAPSSLSPLALTCTTVLTAS